MPTPSQPFDPARFTGIADCGMMIVEGVGFQMEFRCRGDRAGYFVVTMGDRRKSFSIAMGAAEWKEFRAIVGEGERVYRRLTETGQCDELAPVV